MKKALLVLLLSACALAQKPVPPADWATPAEKSGYRTTPRYDETMAYLRRIAAAAPRQVKLEVFGRTPEGRDLYVAIASKDGVFDPAVARKSGRAVLLIQNAIHAGEMDGKDACLALLRDLVVTKTKAALLDNVVVVIIPIYNLDGHERFGAYNRINQNGPEEMGWRTTAQNFNLNRDYLKADAPETRAFLKLWQRWLPDYFVDDHVTDGADFQYDVTYALDSGPDVAPAIAAWQRDVVFPYLHRQVEAAGHVPSHFFYIMDETDPAKGVVTPPDSPRFSTGYAVIQNRPGMLVEMHMLKDYKTRVTGNYAILVALLELLNRDAAKLVAMNRAADEEQVAAGRKDGGAQVVLQTRPAPQKSVPFAFKGYKFRRSLSEVSGAMRVEYTQEPLNVTVPWLNTLEPVRAVAAPRAYIVPAVWTKVIELLAAHGVEMRRTTTAWTGEVETYRCTGAKWQERSFEGHHLMTIAAPNAPAGAPGLRCAPEKTKLTFPAGSVVVPLDQRAAKVAVHILEPEAPDSAVAWGMFDTIFEQKEYGESYVLEKLARDMMAKDPKLKAEFEQKVATDKEFAASPTARLNFFYQRSPWWDEKLGLYPVGRLASLEGVPVGK